MLFITQHELWTLQIKINLILLYYIFRFEWFSEIESIEHVNSSKNPKYFFRYQEDKTKGLCTYVTMRRTISLLTVKNVNNR